jgi:hypothetical protein
MWIIPSFRAATCPSTKLRKSRCSLLIMHDCWAHLCFVHETGTLSFYLSLFVMPLFQGISPSSVTFGRNRCVIYIFDSIALPFASFFWFCDGAVCPTFWSILIAPVQNTYFNNSISGYDINQHYYTQQCESKCLPWATNPYGTTNLTMFALCWRTFYSASGCRAS